MADLQINVAQLLKEPVGSTRVHRFDREFQSLDDAGTSYAKGTARLTRTNEGIWTTANVVATMENVCGRCLVPFGQWVPLELNELFRPLVDIATGARLYPAKDEESFTIDRHHELDLAEAIRQYAATAVPIKPLCRPDCQGLCQRCGADLNEGPCQCATDGDPRWAPLQQMIAGQADR